MDHGPRSDEPRVRIEGRAGAPGQIRFGGFEMLEGEHGPETHHVVEPNGGIMRDVAPVIPSYSRSGSHAWGRELRVARGSRFTADRHHRL